MTPEEVQSLLMELTRRRSIAFSGDAPMLSEIQAIILELGNLPISDRPNFKEFVVELKNMLFESASSVAGIDLSGFDEIKQVEGKPHQENSVEDTSTISLLDALKEIFDCLDEELVTLKNSFYVKLFSGFPNFTRILLFEEGCFYQPVKRRFIDKYGDCLCLSIDDFKESMEKGVFAEKSFVALLLITTRMNDTRNLERREQILGEIFHHFEEVSQLTPKARKITSLSDLISSTDLDSFFDEIKYVSSSFLSNSELTNEEEKIIKKLFRDANVPILEYRVLKGGKSGSKVLEVRPRKNYATNQTKRFIVKFSQYDSQRKIAVEAKRFGDHIEHYSVPNYTKTYERIANTEAIKYTYASRDSIVKAHSFSEIISDQTNEFFEQRKEIIEETFDSEPFSLWQQSKEMTRLKVSNLYEDYVKPSKFFSIVRKIKAITELQLQAENIYSVFNEIFNLDLDVALKVCHGDFHTENFFKDSSGVYLIDFGFTDKRHAVIDHTTLECSIKFKHIPFFIEMKDLVDIEKQLVSDDSFNATFELKTLRADVKAYFDLIKVIRLNSLKNIRNENDKLEYLISLFMLTCRNVQYPDLNQLYALKSAEIIGEHIMQVITGKS